nr:fibronectin type III domain-containing protein [Halobellus captivus]
MVPSGVELITIELEGQKGGQNGSGPAGDGGRVVGELATSGGETLYIRESLGGLDGFDSVRGGNSIDVRMDGTALSDRIAVAAGGGSDGEDGVPGGDGGPSQGEDGGSATLVTAATGGTQSSGGSGGTDDSTYGNGDGSDGSFGTGGDGESESAGAGGGGGAGWYGGGGGASSDSTADNTGSGAGGSNYVDGFDTVFANERGGSSRSNSAGALATISYTTPPENLTANDVGYRSADLSWDAVSGADKYRVYRDGNQVGTTTNTSYTDTGVSPTTAYDWHVTSVERGAESNPSNTVSGTTGGDAPGGLSVSIDGADATLSWTDTNDDEDGYEVHRSQSAGVDTSGSPVATTAADAESYQDAGLADGTEYHWRVVAVRDGERGADSSEADGLTPLPAPTGLTVDDVRDTEADLSWTTNASGVDEQRVYLKRWGENGTERQRAGMEFSNADETYIAGDTDTEHLRTPEATWTAIVQRTGGGSSNEYVFALVETGGNRILFRIRDGEFQIYDDINERASAVTFETNSFTDGDVHAATITFESDGTKTAYLDGSQVGVDTGGDPLSGLDSGVVPVFSSLQPNKYFLGFDGNLYGVQTHDRILSASEISAVATGEVVGDGLTGYWPLDLNQDGVTPDLSEYANDGYENGLKIANGSFDSLYKWDVSHGGLASGRVYAGENSFFSDADNTGVQAAQDLSTAYQPDTFSYVYQETSNSFGGGIRLVNSNGDYEGGTAADNPEWDVDFADTTGQVAGGPGGSDEWVSVEWDFDWSNSQVTVLWEALTSGDTHSSTHDLYHGADVSRVELWNYNDSAGWGGGDLAMWWDAILFDGNDGGGGPTLTGPTVEDVSGALSGSAESTTVDGLLNGERYEAFVHALTDDNEVRDQ